METTPHTRREADALDLAADAEREAIREDNDQVLDWSRALRPRVPAFPLHHYQLLDPNRASFADQLRERAAANLEREVAFIVNLLGALTLALGIVAMVAL